MTLYYEVAVHDFAGTNCPVASTVSDTHLEDQIFKFICAYMFICAYVFTSAVKHDEGQTILRQFLILH